MAVWGIGRGEGADISVGSTSSRFLQLCNSAGRSETHGSKLGKRSLVRAFADPVCDLNWSRATLPGACISCISCIAGVVRGRRPLTSKRRNEVRYRETIDRPSMILRTIRTDVACVVGDWWWRDT